MDSVARYDVRSKTHIALCRGRWADAVRFIRLNSERLSTASFHKEMRTYQLNVQRVRVHLAIHRDRLDPQLPRGADDATCNLTSARASV